MSKYVATIHAPGCLPDSDAPAPTFDDVADAWRYLWEEYDRAADETEGVNYDGGAHERMYRYAYEYDTPTVGTVRVPTPGYDGDHDLGLAYSVDVVDAPTV